MQKGASMFGQGVRPDIALFSAICLCWFFGTCQTVEEQWFCRNNMPWAECRTYLPSERKAMDRFLKELARTNLPSPGAFKGRGIVMSGGQQHVLQALANLEVIRKIHGSDLPVEYWHAFELGEAHCEALEALGAKCRNLQVPGVYPLFETVLPAILSSSFKDVLWMDTDITPLIKPDLLFDSAAYRDTGALFWPDLWGMRCPTWGMTAWPHHVALHLLGLKHNASDYHYSQEHEPGLHLVDKERHWKPLCLANYLAGRDFFTRVMYGYKDVFRLAWLKLGASNFLSDIRPGLVGLLLPNGQFFGSCLIHFWRAGGEFGESGNGRHVPIYVHQKKYPGLTWGDIATFKAPLGDCIDYSLQPFVPEEAGAELWHINYWDPSTLNALTTIDNQWNGGYNVGLETLSKDSRLNEEEIHRLHPTRSVKKTQVFQLMANSCRCDYSDNRWFKLITVMASGFSESHALAQECQDMLKPGIRTQACEIGHASRALLCSQVFIQTGDEAATRIALTTLKELLPKIQVCLPNSFWPVQLEDLNNFMQAVATKSDLIWRGKFQLPKDRLAKFPRYLRRCIPLRDSSCWTDNFDGDEKGTEVRDPHMSCLYCCDPNYLNEPWRANCFDQVYTEERCCLAAWSL